jgi:hypothetical protein
VHTYGISEEELGAFRAAIAVDHPVEREQERSSRP